MGEADDDLTSRDRGFLTQHDREYLLDQHDDMTDNNENQKRYQIRERFRNAMYDFYFISEYLSNRDKRLLWPEIDHWLWKAQNRRQQRDDFAYPEVPLLAKCWRDVVSVFIESHILTGIPEAEYLAKWVIEEGVNKGVRRKTLKNAQMYREVDAELDWGIGELVKLQSYLQQITDQMPTEPEPAEEYLLSLLRQGYLTRSHSIYLYQNYIES
jgi:hypothetical protein